MYKVTFTIIIVNAVIFYFLITVYIQVIAFVETFLPHSNSICSQNQTFRNPLHKYYTFINCEEIELSEQIKYGSLFE